MLFHLLRHQHTHLYIKDYSLLYIYGLYLFDFLYYHFHLVFHLHEIISNKYLLCKLRYLSLTILHFIGSKYISIHLYYTIFRLYLLVCHCNIALEIGSLFLEMICLFLQNNNYLFSLLIT